MKTWNIQYLSYAGQIVNTTIETPDDASSDDAENELYKQEQGLYSSDDVFEIMNIEEIKAEPTEEEKRKQRLIDKINRHIIENIKYGRKYYYLYPEEFDLWEDHQFDWFKVKFPTFTITTNTSGCTHLIMW